MPITPVALALIQRAGEALQKANQQIAQEMAGQSSALVATITSAPFGGEADKALTDLRNVAVVHHELGSLREKLKTIYLSAMEGNGRDRQGWSSRPSHTIRACASRCRRRRKMCNRVGEKAKSKAKSSTNPSKASAPRPLSPSASKVLATLSTMLNKAEMTAVQQTSLAALTSVSCGDVNTAIKALVAQGLILGDGKGSYRLP